MLEFGCVYAVLALPVFYKGTAGFENATNIRTAYAEETTGMYEQRTARSNTFYGASILHLYHAIKKSAAGAATP